MIAKFNRDWWGSKIATEKLSTYEPKNESGELLNQMIGLVREQASHGKIKYLFRCDARKNEWVTLHGKRKSKREENRMIKPMKQRMKAVSYWIKWWDWWGSKQATDKLSTYWGAHTRWEEEWVSKDRKEEQAVQLKLSTRVKPQVSRYKVESHSETLTVTPFVTCCLSVTKRKNIVLFRDE